MTRARILFGILILVLLGVAVYFGDGLGQLFRARGPQPQGPDEFSPSVPASTPDVTGKGFRGPTGEPHIIGPKSNPPNY